MAAPDEVPRLGAGNRRGPLLRQHGIGHATHVLEAVDQRAVEVENDTRHQAAFHLIEQPIDGTCSFGPSPVSATCFIAS